MRFYTGTHHPGWLRHAEFPLFISRRRLERYRTLPESITPWVLDSGGFTELSMHGRWNITPEAYARFIRRCCDETGLLQWAAPQDWMCEPWILEQTGLTVAEHQRLTVENYIVLKFMGAPVIPVLQGWTAEDYLRCADLYCKYGVELDGLVGVGSVCRRQASDEIADIFRMLNWYGLTQLHGFGVKSQGLGHYRRYLASADSMAWSYAARRESPLPGHTHKNCANCYEYASRWRSALEGTEGCQHQRRYTSVDQFRPGTGNAAVMCSDCGASLTTAKGEGRA